MLSVYFPIYSANVSVTLPHVTIVPAVQQIATIPTIIENAPVQTSKNVPPWLSQRVCAAAQRESGHDITDVIVNQIACTRLLITLDLLFAGMLNIVQVSDYVLKLQMVGLPGTAPGQEQPSAAKECINLSRVLHPSPSFVVIGNEMPFRFGRSIIPSLLTRSFLDQKRDIAG